METAESGWWNSVKLIPFWLASLLIVAAMLLPKLLRTRDSPEQSSRLASVRTEQTTLPPSAAPLAAKVEGGVVGGVPGGVRALQAGTSSVNAAADFGRKLVRSSSIQAVVKNPTAAAQQIEEVARQLGGFVESSEILGTREDSSASIVIRIPADRLQEAEKRVNGLAVRIENETTTVTDSTRDYVDREARLRNLHAEEAQYLTIMKSASHVKDMLAVTEKLSDVRGEIEQEQAEFETLSRQVETASLKIALRTEVDTQVLGIEWRPLYQLKLAVRDGLDSVASYAITMLGLIFQLPAVALWFGTVIFLGVVSWRILRWVWRTFFVLSQPTPAKAT
jgi:Domain of unknown function (DUF4349)